MGLSAVARVLLATLVALPAPSVQRRANGGRLARRRQTPRRPLAATLCTFHVAALHFLARLVVLQVHLVLLRTNGSRSAGSVLLQSGSATEIVESPSELRIAGLADADRS